MYLDIIYIKVRGEKEEGKIFMKMLSLWSCSGSWQQQSIFRVIGSCTSHASGGWRCAGGFHAVLVPNSKWSELRTD